jgi:hypothetical protein
VFLVINIVCKDKHFGSNRQGFEPKMIMAEMIAGSENLIISGDKRKIPQAHQGFAESCDFRGLVFCARLGEMIKSFGGIDGKWLMENG